MGKTGTFLVRVQVYFALVRDFDMAAFQKLERFARSGEVDSCVRASVYECLDTLTQILERFGLRHTTMSVLRAMCSFLPAETRTSGNGRTIIWPSNETLIERANGIPERTLRRHIQKLVDAGIITRRNSANGKRFALRLNGTPMTAFGFDLGPLLKRQAEFSELRNEALREEEQKAILRAEIRAHLMDDTVAETERSNILTMLRRKLSVTELQDILSSIRPHNIVPTEMAATDRQNGRDIQNTKKESKLVKESASDVSLNEALEAIPESLSFSAEAVTSWDSIRGLGKQLAPMIGIKEIVFEKACLFMGPDAAALSVLCVIEMQKGIRSPAAYFNTMADRARVGRFSLRGLLKMATNTRKGRGFAPANVIHSLHL